MIRKGECNQCGWCCEFMEIQRITISEQQALTPDIEYFYLLRNGIKCNDGKIRLISHQFIPCNNHINKNCNKYIERPDFCKMFPTIPEQIEGTPCSYWFELDGINRGGLGSPYPTAPKF